MESKKFCINPQTKRNITIGGKKYWQLVRKGLIDDKIENLVYDPKNDIDVENMNKEEIYKHLYEKKEELKDTIPEDKVLAISANKLITKKPTMSMKEVSNKTAESALNIIDAIQNNEIEIPSNMTRGEARDYLQNLIFQKMLSNQKKFVNTKLEKTGLPIRKIPKYYISKDTETELTETETETETDY